MRAYGPDVVGVDIESKALDEARRRYPQCLFLKAAGENLPFASGHFTHVDSGVSIPYMEIRKTFKELYRVLRAGGTVRISVHTWRLTLREFRVVRSPIALCYRLYVLLNGISLHLNGPLFHFLNTGRIESFQTEAGMFRELRRAGFEDVQVGSRDPLTFWGSKPR
jgi:ubiquinone/menaquinone biosynthesis C-methylase UbiE